MSSNYETPIEVEFPQISFADDDFILSFLKINALNTEEDKPASFHAGTAKVTVINKTEAPLQKTDFNVLLELTGAGLSEDRPGLDLVAVLDISESMRKDQRLEKLQRAMAFLIRKLSSIDRLSIVAFCNVATRYCRLRQVTEKSRTEIESMVNSFTAAGGTDIPAGVLQALYVLESRRYTVGRTAAIIVMSDGKTDNKTDEEMDREISQLQLKDVPVFTFGFGEDQDSRVLNSIARCSKGGTFSDVENTDNLSLAFSQCLAGLLTVVVQDLNLTVTPLTVPPLEPTTIENVNAGDYLRLEDINVAGSVTVAFGDLYDKEVRKVLVKLVLPKAESRIGMDFLRISLTYKSKGKVLNAPPIPATVTRTGKPTEEERDEIVVELERLRAARTIREAREFADGKKLGKARKDQATYEKLGRPFALSTETLHALQRLQRYPARGEKLRLFATSKKLDQDRNMIVPDSKEDVKEEIEADPLATAVKALQDIKKILDAYGL